MRWTFYLACTALLLHTAAVRAQGEPKFRTIYFGVKACLPCHEKESETFANQEKLSHSPDVRTARLLEFNVWSKHDKHKDAAKVLHSERSKQIAAIMKLPADLTNEPRCANCHGVYIDPAHEKDLIHADTFKGDDRLASGVSCVACHGPIAEWVNEHVVPLPKKKWSERSRDEKKTQFGLRDLWNPVERAELCFSCHIGNIKEGKFVTHEMYAAGHPPLPGIEMAAFSEAMPAHWESLQQKAARARERGTNAKNGPPFLKTAYGLDAASPELEETRTVAIAGLAALQSSVRMMSEYAAEANSGKADRPWPELAFYDCYACHHDLKSKSWRLERGFAGKPGRPVMRPWPFAVARAADRLVEPNPAFDPALTAWHSLFQDVPFGDAKKVATEGHSLDKLLEARIRTLAAKKFDRQAATRFARSLAEAASNEAHDFDSARQFAWALRSIAIDLQNEGRYGLAKPGEQRLKGPIGGLLNGLDTPLQLRLPEGQVEIVPALLDRVFQQISAYDPTEFRKTMKAIGANLP